MTSDARRAYDRAAYKRKMADPLLRDRERARNRLRMRRKRATDSAFYQAELQKRRNELQAMWAESPEYRARCRDRKRAAYQVNPAPVRERNSRWDKTEKGRDSRRRRDNARRAAECGAGGTISQAEWQQILNEQDNRCGCCGESFANVRPELDHIVPISKGGSHTAGNAQALCRSCNAQKHDKTMCFRAGADLFYIDSNGRFGTMPRSEAA